MRLVANKPCSFGGRKFYIGEEIPGNLVADARLQEKMGVITIVKDGTGEPGEQSGTLFTLEQVEKMIEEAVDEAVNNTVSEMGQINKGLQEAAGTLQTGILQGDGFLPENTVVIPVKGDSNGDSEQQTAVPADPEEIRQVFAIMQMNAPDGAAAIAGVKSENVLILLHAADSRKTIKDAARKQADNIFHAQSGTNEPTGCNVTTGANMEGAGT